MIGNVLQVAIGGALGSVARYLVVSGMMPAIGPGFPWGTLAVNAAGCFAMGLLWVWLAERDLLRLAPLVTAGFLGGFTTFSAFSLDAFGLWEKGATGAAVAYVGASVGVSLAALVAGVLVMRGMLA